MGRTSALFSCRYGVSKATYSVSGIYSYHAQKAKYYVPISGIEKQTQNGQWFSGVTTDWHRYTNTQLYLGTSVAYFISVCCYTFQNVFTTIRV